MSPVFLREDGFRFKIYSNEESRLHIHVIKGDCEAKYWLEPHIELACNYGFARHELSRIEQLINQHGNDFKEQFRRHIGKRLDD